MLTVLTAGCGAPADSGFSGPTTFPDPSSSAPGDGPTTQAGNQPTSNDPADQASHDQKADAACRSLGVESAIREVVPNADIVYSWTVPTTGEAQCYWQDPAVPMAQRDSVPEVFTFVRPSTRHTLHSDRQSSEGVGDNIEDVDDLGDDAFVSTESGGPANVSVLKEHGDDRSTIYQFVVSNVPDGGKEDAISIAQAAKLVTY
ncbi:hypothetical protein SAMN04488544_1275 [Microlunatus sagamiharensis]|uniref:DUF3558 domain-containing protein n=1 Tax=Microlunatus sagamiharensis TaxID=546874 RepID=A0A1H2M2J0_9ACTN|nr:hypothetical protein [Microlunatus sagamiharensis]SDU87332.1 hypothetical protein SAMN04488544_1275 [Microlunatus sagamiharensis]